MQAKFQLSIMNDLNLTNGTYDFFGDESKFTKCIQNVAEYEMSSACSSNYCQQKEKSQVVKAIPSVSRQECKGIKCFSDAVIKWLLDSWIATCNIPLSDPLPPEEYINWDKNMLTLVFLLLE